MRLFESIRKFKQAGIKHFKMLSGHENKDKKLRYWLSHLFCIALAGVALCSYQREGRRENFPFFASAQNHTKQMTQPVEN